MTVGLKAQPTLLYDGGYALGLCPPYFLPTLTLPSVLKLDVSAKRGLPTRGHWVFDTACPSNFAPKERVNKFAVMLNSQFLL